MSPDFVESLCVSSVSVLGMSVIMTKQRRNRRRWTMHHWAVVSVKSFNLTVLHGTQCWFLIQKLSLPLFTTSDAPSLFTPYEGINWIPKSTTTNLWSKGGDVKAWRKVQADDRYASVVIYSPTTRRRAKQLTRFLRLFPLSYLNLPQYLTIYIRPPPQIQSLHSHWHSAQLLTPSILSERNA